MDPILLVDDDRALCQMLSEYLELEGFEVACAHSGDEGLALSRGRRFAVIVLDVMMPGLNGFDTLKALRQEAATPVLMMSARGEEIDRILGLEIGADDYLPKPCSPRELLARIRAIIRRVALEQGEEPGATTRDSLELDALHLDLRRHRARYGAQALELTHTEWLVLELLMREAGSLVSRERLTRYALKRSLGPFDRAIDMHLSNLRKKLAALAGDALCIRTVRGQGYLLLPPDDTDANADA
ncbi:response regulator [Motiliproteus sp. SC1-56]|uniref:response regulator n=1 Tax=Motiliproteus sp. SC1-56 TaxID=2799565 RepID=UPI001A900780|nr:response regulator [Motiliproteus sp. SC1-56]